MRSTYLAFVCLLLAASDARADEPSSPPPAAPDPAPARKDDPTVFLHVASAKTVAIVRDDTGEVVCVSPCDKSVQGDVKYRVQSDRPSPSFLLAAPASGRADLRVKAGSKTGFWVGVGGLVLGAALIGGGIATLVYGVENRAEVPGADSETTDNSYTDAMSIGATLVVGGVFAALGGGAFLLANATTKVRGDIQVAPNGSMPSASAARRAAAAPRAQALPGLPRPQYVPLFTGTF